MVLIKCPECGKENLSDSTEACPDCGYGIKMHFKRYGQEERLEKFSGEMHSGKENSKLKIERKKNVKFLKMIIPLCIILVSVMIGTVIINRNKKHELLMESAYNSFSSDFEDYVKSLNVHGINIDASFKIVESTQEDDILNLSCYTKYISDDLNKYADVKKNSSEAEELFNIFERINQKKNARHFFTYHIDDKTVSINIEGSGGSSVDFIIYDSNLHEYHYYSNDNYEKLEIDNTIVFSKGEAENPKTSNNTDNYSDSSKVSSYIENYDATLEYGSDSVLVFISEDAMGRYMSALNNDNQGIIDEMESSGEAGWTVNGTKCNIIEKGFGKYQVKLLDGIYEGSTVWVFYESINENKN
ncbi:MAG: zinc ribbon domain-containing protein [Lachnospiraceae bacterium]